MTHRGPFQPLPFCDSVIQTRACVLWSWQPWRDSGTAGTARVGGRDGAADWECALGFSLQLGTCCQLRKCFCPCTSPHATHAFVWVCPCPPRSSSWCPGSTWELVGGEGLAQVNAMSPRWGWQEPPEPLAGAPGSVTALSSGC